MLFLQKSCPTRKRVGAGVYAGNMMATAVCRLRGCGAGDRCADGWRGQYGNGGVQAAAVWRMRMDLMDRMDKMGAPRDNPRVGDAVGRWGAWGQIYRRGMRAM